MLIALRQYLQQKEQVNLQELAWHFQQPPEVVRSWLEHWMQKGKVCRCEQPAGCGSRCQMCKPEVAEVYRWAEKLTGH